MPHYKGIPKLRCRDRENASGAGERLVGANPPPCRFTMGFWNDPPKEDERLVAAISARPGDPDFPVFDRRPDKPLPYYLQPPVLEVCRYEAQGRHGYFAVQDENGEHWVVRLPEQMLVPSPGLAFYLGDTISRSLIVAGPFRSMTRAERWVIFGTPDEVPLRSDEGGSP